MTLNTGVSHGVKVLVDYSLFRGEVVYFQLMHVTFYDLYLSIQLLVQKRRGLNLTYLVSLQLIPNTPFSRLRFAASLNALSHIFVSVSICVLVPEVDLVKCLNVVVQH